MNFIKIFFAVLTCVWSAKHLVIGFLKSLNVEASYNYNSRFKYPEKFLEPFTLYVGQKPLPASCHLKMEDCKHCAQQSPDESDNNGRDKHQDVNIYTPLNLCEYLKKLSEFSL